MNSAWHSRHLQKSGECDQLILAFSDNIIRRRLDDYPVVTSVADPDGVKNY
jgi:hypothetical protein